MQNLTFGTLRWFLPLPLDERQGEVRSSSSSVARDSCYGSQLVAMRRTLVWLLHSKSSLWSTPSKLWLREESATWNWMCHCQNFTSYISELWSQISGEFEKHAGCWMGWPYDGNLWRENAKPAQAQYAAIAKAISQFEPLTMFAHPGEVSFTVTPTRCLGPQISNFEVWWELVSYHPVLITERMHT